MDKIDELLQYVRKTNPEMTRARLIFELSQSRYSTAGLWKWKRKRSIRSGIRQGCKRTRSVQGRVRRN